MPAPPFQITALEPRDLPGALGIFNHYIRTSTAVYMDAPLSEAEFQGMLFFPDPRHGSFAIFREGRSQGYMTLKPYSPRSGYRDTAEISIFLHPDCTGQGTGSTAIAFLEERARERGFHALVAGISGDNEASLRLFEGKGYARVAHFREVAIKFGRRLDTFFFEKILP